jgi:hypothetical protein
MTTLPLIFVLAFAALLLMQIGAADALRALRSIARWVREDVGHDSQIFPDHTTDQ